jgi:hypothetical protein
MFLRIPCTVCSDTALGREGSARGTVRHRLKPRLSSEILGDKSLSC